MPTRVSIKSKRQKSANSNGAKPQGSKSKSPKADSKKRSSQSAKSPTRKKKKARRGKQIHVLTDGTGGLPRHFLTAILSQFPHIEKEPKYHIFCDTPAKTKEAFEAFVRRNSIVIHSFAETENKSTLIELAAANSIPCFDLTGSAVKFLAEQTGSDPVQDLDRVHAHDAHYFDRIDAWEYTMQHDDSRRLESIYKADIILLGLSRVSKTPTSAYLGWLGHRVANVSFTPDCGIPKEVMKCKKKVIALTMQPKQLSEIRGRRMQVNGFSDVIADDPDGEIQYAGLRFTIQEVMRAEQLYKKMGVPVVDVTDSTVEETAARVLEIIGE